MLIGASFIETMSVGFRHHIRQLLSDQKGSAIVLIGFAILMLVLAGGVAVDLARNQAVQSRLHAAIDAAGLAAGKVGAQELPQFFAGNMALATVQQDIQNAANNYFTANFPSGYLGTQPYGTSPITVTLVNNNTQIQLSSSVVDNNTIMIAAQAPTTAVGDQSLVTAIASTDGQCGTIPNSCNGTLNNTLIAQINQLPSPANNYTYSWTCPGTGNGASVPCTATLGECDPNNEAVTGMPNSGCISGTNSNITTAGNGVNWSCVGISAITGFNLSTITTSNCAATNGACSTNPPATVGCAPGTPTITASANPNITNWTCTGNGDGGTSANCTFTNGMCGTTGFNTCDTTAGLGPTGTVVSAANGTWTCPGSVLTPGNPTTIQGTTAPCGGGITPACDYSQPAASPGACQTGSTPNGFTGPDPNSGVMTWNCAIAGDPADSVACTATNAICDPIVAGNCLAGTNPSGPDNFTTIGGTDVWTCAGSNNGSNANCTVSAAVVPSTPQCDFSNPGICITGIPSAVLNFSGGGSFWYCYTGSGSNQIVAPCQTSFETEESYVTSCSGDIYELNYKGVSTDEGYGPSVGSINNGQGDNILGYDAYDVNATSPLVECPNGGAVSGACDNALFTCISGSPSWYDEANGIWTCSGSGGASAAYCNVPPVVNGQCGTTLDSCAQGFFQIQLITPSSPVDGSPSSVTDVYNDSYYYTTGYAIPGSYAVYLSGGPPDAGGYQFQESSGGPPLNTGKNWVNVTNVAAYSSATQANFLQWACIGENGGTAALCSMPAGSAVNGQCGAWVGDTSGSGTCLYGTAFQTGNNGYTGTWDCNGSGAGNNTTCGVDLVGQCGSNVNQCVTGYSNNEQSVDNGDGTSTYTWDCDAQVSNAYSCTVTEVNP